MYTILITTSSFAKFNKQPLEVLNRQGLNIIFNPYCRKLAEDEVSKLIQDYNPVGMIAGVEPLTSRVFEQSTELKAIARAGIGLDSVDLAVAKRQGISVTSTPDAPTIPVAELTLGMILSLLRKIHISDLSIKNREWQRPMGNLLHNKTVGLIGCGRIGSELAKYLKPFKCNILGSDPACTLHDHISITDLKELLQNSDIVSLHLPYSTETRHYMDKTRIQSMKTGSYLINAARGGLVDESALYDALDSGHLAGAALDCFEEEPYTGPLRDLPNTLLSAHIGSYAKEARVMMETQAAENLISQLKDKGVI